MPKFTADPNPLRPCGGPCGRPTRPSSMGLSKAPGTVTRLNGTHCNSCYKRAKRAAEGAAAVPEDPGAVEAAKEAKRQEGYAAAFRAEERFRLQRQARLQGASRKRRVDA